MQIEINRLDERAALPEYKSELAAGMDLSACLGAPVVLEPGEIELIPTGFAMALPAGYEAQVRPRSGLAIRHGVTVVNAPGTIDADFRGQVMVGLINLGKQPFTIEHGTRVAQMVIARVARATIVERKTLAETVRGEGGFGSTGLA
jgi:dUTP pyrophosphatase